MDFIANESKSFEEDYVSEEDNKSEVKSISNSNSKTCCRPALMFFVNTIESANKTFNPLGVDLDGFSHFMMSRQEQYDNIFKELYEKYSNIYTKIKSSIIIGVILLISINYYDLIFHWLTYIFSAIISFIILGNIILLVGYHIDIINDIEK